jgi:hypothetical protein
VRKCHRIEARVGLVLAARVPPPSSPKRHPHQRVILAARAFLASRGKAARLYGEYALIISSLIYRREHERRGGGGGERAVYDRSIAHER